MQLSDELRAEYQDLWDTMKPVVNHLAEIQLCSNKIRKHKARYEAIQARVGAPWYLVGVVHMLEASCSFTKHLHNGDPLWRRTSHVPIGRPKAGEPPFSWEFSAEDALTSEPHFWHYWHDWTIPGMLYRLEDYNGWGYRKYHRNTLSPYLWSYSNHYTRGKYASDGKFDGKLVSRQCGAAVLLENLIAGA